MIKNQQKKNKKRPYNKWQGSNVTKSNRNGNVKKGDEHETKETTKISHHKKGNINGQKKGQKGYKTETEEASKKFNKKSTKKIY